MVKGLDTFKNYFKDYNDQYVLIGGTACDILFESRASYFRSTRDLDMVLIIEALTPNFVIKFHQFIKDGKYRNKMTYNNKSQFYRFDKPEDESFPKMIELFCRKSFSLKKLSQLTPIHVDDTISSLSAILLDEDYYKLLKDGKTIVDGLSILRPEYLILFKAKAYLDLSKRLLNGEHVDSNDIKKHKKDILRISVELVLKPINNLPFPIYQDIRSFINSLGTNPFDRNLLDNYNISNQEIIEMLRRTFII